MQAQAATWGDLHVGAYMRDQTGETWKVIAERDFNYQVQNRAGDKRRLHPRDPRTPVTLLVPSEEEALATLQDKLQARVLARRAAGETGWLVPAFPTSSKQGGIADARAHLKLAHGVWADDVKTIADLIECHVEHHRNPDKGHQEHTHPGGNPS